MQHNSSLSGRHRDPKSLHHKALVCFRRRVQQVNITLFRSSSSTPLLSCFVPYGHVGPCAEQDFGERLILLRSSKLKRSRVLSSIWQHDCPMSLENYVPAVDWKCNRLLTCWHITGLERASRNDRQRIRQSLGRSREASDCRRPVVGGDSAGSRGSRFLDSKKQEDGANPAAAAPHVVVKAYEPAA